jgi:hypothetical protein
VRGQRRLALGASLNIAMSRAVAGPSTAQHPQTREGDTVGRPERAARAVDDPAADLFHASASPRNPTSWKKDEQRQDLSPVVLNAVEILIRRRDPAFDIGHDSAVKSRGYNKASQIVNPKVFASSSFSAASSIRTGPARTPAAHDSLHVHSPPQRGESPLT